MDLNFAAFQEPRGVMRILHFVFSICAFATITGYDGLIQFNCNGSASIGFSYPFSDVKDVVVVPTVNKTCNASLRINFSSDAEFFVATGVLSMLYALAIMIVYAKMDEVYQSNKSYPLYDFLATVFLAVLWISSSAAWANALTGLKTATTTGILNPPDCCVAVTSGFSTLNISVIFGFLNFFLWAADLWFLYKETAWFQGNAMPSNGV